jgi:hypothetical protein
LIPAPMPNVAAPPIVPTRIRPTSAPMKSIRIAFVRWSLEGILETWAISILDSCFWR